MNLTGKRVFVGLSGGVDSAVSAALLQKAGAEVTGVFIKGWYPPGLPCTWAADRRDAMRVAAKLHVPFVTLDASREYKKGVIDYLLAEYKRGRTPNPDVMCNREVKFGAFYRYANEQGADFIATGHYAQGGAEKDGALLRGVDPGKDQSYFLWAVPKEVLQKTIFPVGGMPKENVRRLAEQFSLPVAKKKDSQGVCFLGSISVEEFLRAEFGEAPGKAVDEEGKEVGTHRGVLLHTIGERIGLLNAPEGPWFVVAKDVSENVLVVAKNRTPKSEAKTISFTDANWLADSSRIREAQARYHAPILAGTISGDSFILSKPPSELPAPGQSIVFYNGPELIGGGIIS